MSSRIVERPVLGRCPRRRSRTGCRPSCRRRDRPRSSAPSPARERRSAPASCRRGPAGGSRSARPAPTFSECESTRVRECGAGRSRMICGPEDDRPVVAVVGQVIDAGLDRHESPVQKASRRHAFTLRATFHGFCCGAARAFAAGRAYRTRGWHSGAPYRSDRLLDLLRIRRRNCRRRPHRRSPPSLPRHRRAGGKDCGEARGSRHSRHRASRPTSIALDVERTPVAGLCAAGVTPAAVRRARLLGCSLPRWPRPGSSCAPFPAMRMEFPAGASGSACGGVIWQEMDALTS